MSLYNAVHGFNPMAGVLLSILGVTRDEIPRFRDCYFDGKHIVIYTRTGGGNREYYENLEDCKDNYPEYFTQGEDPPSGPWNDDLRMIQGFVYDEDDSFDSTYASFYYTVPEQFNYLSDKLNSMAQKETQAERWEASLERIKTASPDDPMVQRLTETFGQLFTILEKQLSENTNEI